MNRFTNGGMDVTLSGRIGPVRTNVIKNSKGEDTDVTNTVLFIDTYDGVKKEKGESVVFELSAFGYTAQRLAKAPKGSFIVAKCSGNGSIRVKPASTGKDGKEYPAALNFTISEIDALVFPPKKDGDATAVPTTPAAPAADMSSEIDDLDF